MRQAGAFLVALLLTLAPAGAQQDPGAPAMPGTGELRVPPAAPTLPSSTIAQPEAQGPLPGSPVLTIDQDILYLQSAWGRRAQARLEAEGELIATENDRLTDILSAEEAALTQQRPGLDPAEFRRLAESFDIRATEIRRERAQAVQALNAWADADRVAFFRAALPVMGEMMQDRGASAVLDRRTVFVSLEGIDITQALIEALDADLGDGGGAVPLPDIRSPHLEPEAAD